MPRLIDADALLAEYDRVHVGEPGRARKLIEDAPTVDAEPVRHGRWVDDDCSVCGFPIPTDDRLDAIFEEEVKYCYHCGAKMDGGAK